MSGPTGCAAEWLREKFQYQAVLLHVTPNYGHLSGELELSILVLHKPVNKVKLFTSKNIMTRKQRLGRSRLKMDSVWSSTWKKTQAFYFQLNVMAS